MEVVGQQETGSAKGDGHSQRGTGHSLHPPIGCREGQGGDLPWWWLGGGFGLVVGVARVTCLLWQGRMGRPDPGCSCVHPSPTARFPRCGLDSVCTWFECVSMLVILLNCVTLGMYQPCDDMDCLSDRCKILQVRGPREPEERGRRSLGDAFGGKIPLPPPS